MTLQPGQWSWRIAPVRMGGTGRTITFELLVRRAEWAREESQTWGTKANCRKVLEQLRSGEREFCAPEAAR